MRLAKEEFFLASMLVPLAGCLIILLATVKAPSDLFKSDVKKPKTRKIQKVMVKEVAPKEEVAAPPLPSLSASLAAPAASLGGDLKSLSAGVVSEGSGGSGGLNITQGDAQASTLMDQTQGTSRPARVLQVVSPSYPQSAQARGIEGHVIIEVVISDKGQVTEARVISAVPAGLFDAVAMEAIKKWTFEPGLENGKAIVSRIKQKVNFELN